VADGGGSSLLKGLMREMKVVGTCPICGREDLVMRSLPLEIPHFGDALQTTVLCTQCAFRHADLILGETGPPTRYELSVSGQADLTARVARSSSGTLRIPELEVAVEPGLRGEAFVSNAEGVLRRVRDIVAFLSRSAETRTGRERAKNALRRLDDMIDGRAPFTLILEDPTGNSAILHEKARRRSLTAREAARLKHAPNFRISP